jgi:hypothetical protein
MKRRRSWPNCEHDPPQFNPESTDPETHCIEKRGARTQGKRSIKMFWKFTCTVFVLFVGYASARIGDKSGFSFQKVQEDDEHSTMRHPRDDDQEYWRHNWRDTFHPNGLPLDHKPVMNPDDYTMVQEYPPFVVSKPKEYEMVPLHWASNGKKVDKHARVVGLPPSLTEEIQKFCMEIGLDTLFQWASHPNDLDIGETIITHPNTLKEGHKWAITRTGEDRDSTHQHWLHTIDEKSYEATVDVLKRGNFDYVLGIIANEFKPWGYMFAGMGFTVGVHSEASVIHRETPGGGKNLLKLVFPVHLPEHNVAQLYVGNEEERKVAPVDLEYHQGLLLSGDTVHGTADFDYRSNDNIQIFASIYIADIEEDNIDMIAEDNTALFPFSGNTGWLLAQRGRFWGGTYGGSFELDRGRKSYKSKDDLENCQELAERRLCLEPSQLNNDPGLWDVRRFCPMSCGIFIDDETYFSTVHPSLGQSEVLQVP